MHADTMTADLLTEFCPLLIRNATNPRGKRLHGGGTYQGIGPFHLVSASASEKGLTQAQVPTVQKSNEIAAFQSN